MNSGLSLPSPKGPRHWCPYGDAAGYCELIRPARRRLLLSGVAPVGGGNRADMEHATPLEPFERIVAPRTCPTCLGRIVIEPCRVCRLRGLLAGGKVKALPKAQ
jgi:hypothetical protein